MKRLVQILLVLIVIAAAGIAWTFVPRPLDPGAAPPPDETSPLPGSNIVDVSVIHTGTMSARAAFSFRGGSFGDVRQFVMPVMVVRHPGGTVLIDAGFGRNVEQHLADEPFLMRALSEIHPQTPAADQLSADTPIRAILLTHAHWDHVSGTEDFVDVPVYLPHSEKTFVESDHEASRLARKLAESGRIALKTYDFSDGPYAHASESLDYFGDGSVVIVPAPGHTPGSVWIYVSASSGQRFLLVGDTVWQHEGFELPAERPWIARRRIDSDANATRELIRRLFYIHQSGDWHILPAHDQQAWQAVAEFTPVRTVSDDGR